MITNVPRQSSQKMCGVAAFVCTRCAPGVRDKSDTFLDLAGFHREPWVECPNESVSDYLIDVAHLEDPVSQLGQFLSFVCWQFLHA